MKNFKNIFGLYNILFSFVFRLNININNLLNIGKKRLNLIYKNSCLINKDIL